MADVGQKSVGQAGPDYIEQDLDDLCAMFDPAKLLHTGQGGGIGPDNCREDWQVDQTQSPSSNTGRPDTLLGRLANRIKAIMGKTDWKADPDTTLAAVKTHMDDASKHSGIASIEDISNPGGNVDLVGGTGISISTNPSTKQITITATGTATPAAHASSHATGGSDPVTPASIGAETPAGAQSKVDTHAANASAHHPRYTDAEAVAAIKAADGHGSELDSDTVDGLHGSAFAPVEHVGATGTAHGAATGSAAGFMSAADKTKLDGIAPSAKNVAVLMGTVAHGGTIPLPNGYTQDQCKWFVSPNFLEGDGYYPAPILSFQCSVDAAGVVNVRAMDTRSVWHNGTANYLIIGVK